MGTQRQARTEREWGQWPGRRTADQGGRDRLRGLFTPSGGAEEPPLSNGDEERDYTVEIRDLLADGQWRIAKEIAAPTKKGGIGANVDTVKKVLLEHPDVFESRTGDRAVEIGRSSQATVWGLADGQEGAS